MGMPLVLNKETGMGTATTTPSSVAQTQGSHLIVPGFENYGTIAQGVKDITLFHPAGNMAQADLTGGSTQAPIPSSLNEYSSATAGGSSASTAPNVSTGGGTTSATTATGASTVPLSIGGLWQAGMVLIVGIIFIAFFTSKS
jgi:hypothetical protein